MKTLVINTGSSSIKFALFQMPEGTQLAVGLVERIGEATGVIQMETTSHKKTEELNIPNHQVGLKLVSKWLLNLEFSLLSDTNEVKAIGHRVVHGGETFQKTTEINQAVKNKIKELFGLAPLHNPANYEGIEVAQTVFPNAKQIAVFDTAFHQTLPPKAYHYAIPQYLYQDYGIRVYGFHGTSHRYITQASAEFLKVGLQNVNLITIHLGNGASMAAIKNGQSIDTTLGMTPLSGLVMGTRVGDLDPGVIFYLEEERGYSIEKVKNILNKESGMKGLTGDNDLRSITQKASEGNLQAQLALDIYTYRIKKYIGAYIAIIGPVDAIVFTAGVGENSAIVREMVCSKLDHIGISIDLDKNNLRRKEIQEIQSTDARIKVLITPTNEELEIAKQTYQLLN
jgi:acetate kinase